MMQAKNVEFPSEIGGFFQTFVFGNARKNTKPGRWDARASLLWE